MGLSQGRRPWKWSNATWTRPLSEAVPTLPGSESTSRAKGSRRNLGDPAFGQGTRPGPHREGRTEADDERTREVGLDRSTEKLANKAERSAAEPVEPRVGTKGNANQQHMGRTQSRETVSQVLARIRQTARERKKERFTALFHHINVELLRDAFSGLKPEAAPGVDGLTWQDYAENLEANLQDLHARVQRGAYRALPSRRQYIPKPDGRQRPLAVAALEDIVQRATATLLNAIYEEDFLGFSYGFRPGRSAQWTRSWSESGAGR
jgi:hypothetical protein